MQRGIQYTLYNLGLTSTAQKDYPAARAYLLQSLLVSEELGGTREIVSVLIDLAAILAATGEPEKALELAATAYAHPLCSQRKVWNFEPMNDLAEALRASLQGMIAPEAAEAAWQRGLVADFNSVIAGLIEESASANVRQQTISSRLERR